jgi:TonB family protein
MNYRSLGAFVVLFWTGHSISGQELTKVYYDRDNNPCSPDSSYYFSVGKQNKRGIFYDSLKSYYTVSGRLLSVEIRDVYGIRIGTYEGFYENGRLKIRSQYEKRLKRNSLLDSIEYRILEFRDSTGKILVQNGEGFLQGRRDRRVESGRIVDGFRDSLWITYCDNGKVYSYESWHAGHFIDGISYDQSGKEYYYKNPLILPEPVAGYQEFYQHAAGKLKYPKEAERRGIEGTVVIEFWVELDGTITTPKVISGMSYGCNEAALKVFTDTGLWVPCKQHGQPIRYKMAIPIVFKLK